MSERKYEVKECKMSIGLLGGLGLAIGGGVVSGLFGRSNADRAFRQNEDLSWRMWNAQNAYNTPAAQMKRFADAGLNPNLIYGQSNTASPISVPHATPAPTPDFDLMKGYSLGLELENMEQNIANARTDNALKQQALDFNAQRQVLDVAQRKADIDAKNLQNTLTNKDLDFFSRYGISPSEFGVYQNAANTTVGAAIGLGGKAVQKFGGGVAQWFKSLWNAVKSRSVYNPAPLPLPGGKSAGGIIRPGFEKADKNFLQTVYDKAVNSWRNGGGFIPYS